MAKPSTSFRTLRKVPQRNSHRYIGALVTDDFGRLSTLTTHSANSFAKKKLDEASQSLQLKAERNEKKARRVEIREWRAAERSVVAELREADHRHRLLWRSLKTKVRPDKKLKHTPPKERKRDWPHASVALPKYDGPVIDRRGHRGVFARFRYYSRRTAKAGVSSRVVKYCFNGAELDIDGNPYVATNVGETIDEALCGFDHLEQVNWSAAKNAKLLMHGIFAVDHRQSPDEMMTCGVRWAEETVGRFDLPYLVTLHAPPADGDQRNWHLHILWSYRPLVRTGDHEWQVGEMLRTDLDNPAAMKAFREIFASVMTEMSFESGQNQVWTAKSNADRGLVHEPQVHLGGEKTSRVRDGEYVADNEENHERVLRSKAAVIDEHLRHAGEAIMCASERIRAAMARWARRPAVPMQLPQRFVAAAMKIDPPLFTQRPLPLPITTDVPAVPLPARRSSPATASVPHVTTAARLPPILPIDIPATLAPAVPPLVARTDFANLRNRPIPPLVQRIIPQVVSPAPRPAPAEISVPTGRTLPLPMPLRDVITNGPLPTAGQPSRLPVSALPVVALPQPVATDRLDQRLSRVAEAAQRDDDQLKRDREAVERSASLAKAAAAEHERQNELLHASQAERQRAAEVNGWASYRARRQKWMAQWDEVERLDRSEPPRPGRAMQRPAINHAANPARQRREPLQCPGIHD